jgi:hypothetical protein
MGLSDCRSSGNFWAVSQAAPMRRVNITGGNLTPGLHRRPAVREWRVHRRLPVVVRHQRLAAAVADPQQRGGRLEQRGLEPGLLRRRGRPGPAVLPPRRTTRSRTPRWRPARSLNSGSSPRASTSSTARSRSSAPTPWCWAGLHAVPITGCGDALPRRRRGRACSSRPEAVLRR